jgi:signal transduction histidine kinase
MIYNGEEVGNKVPQLGWWNPPIDWHNPDAARYRETYRTLIGIRANYPALRRGSLIAITSSDDRVAALARVLEGEQTILSVINFSDATLETRVNLSGRALEVTKGSSVSNLFENVLFAVANPGAFTLMLKPCQSRIFLVLPGSEGAHERPLPFTAARSGPMIPARGTNLDAPPFFGRMAVVKAIHLSVLAATYGLALAFFPAISAGLSTHAYFSATYLGCIAASAVLSVLALLSRPSMLLYVILAVRVYLLVVLGYSIGAFLSARLVLGIGLMTEIGVLVDFPYALVTAGLAAAALALAQALPAILGSSALVEVPPHPTFDQLVAYCFVLAAFAVAASLLARLAARRKEQAELIRIQEGNLDTLAELNLSLQGYARTVDEESSERERNRISREIHDISGYIFTNLVALMDAAGSMPRSDQAGLTDLLITARKTAQEGLRETRLALHKLRDEQRRELNTPRAIFKIVSIFRKITGLEVMLSLGNLPNYVGTALNLALYRTVQEALTNAVRHGNATKVRIIFWVEGEELRLTITDNGRGAFEVVKGIGLSGMEERIGALGGTVRVGRAPEGGFSLAVQVPLKTAPGSG